MAAAIGSSAACPVTFPATFKGPVVGFCVLACSTSDTIARPITHPIEGVQAVLAVQNEQFDYGRTKLALDRIIDPSVDATAVEGQIQRLAAAARSLAGPKASDGAKIDAVRKVLYEPGPWNENRPFTYDHSDPLGENIRHKLLSVYLETRLGNCVTMPTLFMIVGRRLGLNLTLSTAPLHVLIRYSRPGIHPFNIEATSGGSFARDEWYRQQFPMSDRAIESGLYLRTHTDRETVAVMATTVMDYLISVARNEEAIAVADVILSANPKDGYVMVRKGTAIGATMKVEFEDKFVIPALIPVNLRRHYTHLATAHQKAFADAEALGWEPVAQ
jgi:regulator of sirC expression with transglutaminase-like and TPR domain